MSQSEQSERVIKIRYFSWVREKVGRSEETISLPERVATISDLIVELRARGETYDAAFTKPETIRAARDHVHVKHSALIGTASEIGFFPPVTGG